jgi:hypothetical protein
MYTDQKGGEWKTLPLNLTVWVATKQAQIEITARTGYTGSGSAQCRIHAYGEPWYSNLDYVYMHGTCAGHYLCCIAVTYLC